jgi:hypothetical protein
MRLAMLGCGYVANMYRLTLPMHPDLKLDGVHDRERSRAEEHGPADRRPRLSDLRGAAGRPEAELVLNLTNPDEHSRPPGPARGRQARLHRKAPRHALDEARRSSSWPSADPDALQRALHADEPGRPDRLARPAGGRAGPVRLVYAEMDDGMVPRTPTAKWINEAGVGWPAVNEFEVGCTVEHAGYVLSWLCAFFGPGGADDRLLDVLQPDKIPGVALRPAPDFSVASLVSARVVARMTNGIYAEHDHRLRFFGDDGALTWRIRAATLRRAAAPLPHAAPAPVPRPGAAPQA